MLACARRVEGGDVRMASEQPSPVRLTSSPLGPASRPPRQQMLASAGITIGRNHHLRSAARRFCDPRDRLSSKFSSSKRGP